jgi:hypothetical protein
MVGGSRISPPLDAPAKKRCAPVICAILDGTIEADSRESWRVRAFSGAEHRISNIEWRMYSGSLFAIRYSIFLASLTRLEIKPHIDLYLSGALSGGNLPEGRNADHRGGISPAHDIEGIDKISAQPEGDLLADRHGLRNR